jgi:hypothetical protein
MRKLAVPAVLALMAATCTAQPNLMGTSTVQNTMPPLKKESTVDDQPATPQQLWERLLRLLAEDKGFTPKDRVEPVLGIRFTERRQETDPPSVGAANFYALKTEAPGFGMLKIGLFDDPRYTKLLIDWGEEYRETSSCLDLAKTTADLHALGWISPDSRRQVPGRGQLDFVRPDELSEAKKQGYFDIRKGYSALYLDSPNAYSNCVNGFTADVWRNPPF